MYRFLLSDRPLVFFAILSSPMLATSPQPKKPVKTAAIPMVRLRSPRSARNMERAVTPQCCSVPAGHLPGLFPIERRVIEPAMEGLSDGDRILQQRSLVAR